ncbi:hypothetical protein AMAG_11579 [Allomyces macrogynus ATCC 38327]|uniref:Uncharacterized protein n=1 Tax=Allomyces macrogynus (strain ATCC 38327) TaxID=578462 RepID=A0A0L0SV99_ALLM3|nr:hypothetical protein AMAG_11579 [Allomyces macrogynus ATCC 38327]|eukprot:KNE66442.1 hypothetical protein AMAG_11579 [Allomyces macrogynus ATCC 38327]
MIASTNGDNGTRSTTTDGGTQLTRGSALIAYLAAPVDAFQGHAVLLSENDLDPTPTPRAAWTLVGTRAASPPILHQCCRPARAHGPRPQHDHDYDHDHDHDHSESDTEDDVSSDDDGWAAPRFYDLVLSDARSRTCRIHNVVKRAGDNLHLESEYPDLVSAGAHPPRPARATDAGPTASSFAFTTTTLYAGLAETRTFLERYFPRLLALVQDAADKDDALDVVVCRGEVVTDAPAVLAEYHDDRRAENEDERGAAPVKKPSRRARAAAESQGDRVGWSDEDE